jgi:LSD1 subclass zinc finger protein
MLKGENAIMINFISCPSCQTPLSLRGDERIIKCPQCGAQVNAGVAKLLYAIKTEHILKIKTITQNFRQM